MFYNLQLGTVPNVEDWRELERCSKVKTHYMCFLFIDFHPVAVSEKFQHAKIILKLVLVLVQNVSCIFMELEGPRPATDVNLDERTSKVDGTCLGGVINVLDSTERRFGFNDGCWFWKWSWDVGS